MDIMEHKFTIFNIISCKKNKDLDFLNKKDCVLFNIFDVFNSDSNNNDNIHELCKFINFANISTDIIYETIVKNIIMKSIEKQIYQYFVKNNKDSIYNMSSFNDKIFDILLLNLQFILYSEVNKLFVFLNDQIDILKKITNILIIEYKKYYNFYNTYKIKLNKSIKIIKLNIFLILICSGYNRSILELLHFDNKFLSIYNEYNYDYIDDMIVLFYNYLIKNIPEKTNPIKYLNYIYIDPSILSNIKYINKNLNKNIDNNNNNNIFDKTDNVIFGSNVINYDDDNEYNEDIFYEQDVTWFTE